MKIKLGQLKSLLDSEQNIYIKTSSHKIYYLGKVEDISENLLEQDILHISSQAVPDPQAEELIPEIAEIIIYVESNPILDEIADEKIKKLIEKSKTKTL